MLPHADDRIVAAVGDREVRFDVERHVGSPVGVAGFDDCGGQINRLIKRIGPTPAT
jgi:hypothetical protein